MTQWRRWMQKKQSFGTSRFSFCAKWLLVTVRMPLGVRELSPAAWTVACGRIMCVFRCFKQNGNEKFPESSQFSFVALKMEVKQMPSPLKCPASR